MIGSLAAVLVLATGWSFTDLGLESLRWNSRERTATGIEVLNTDEKQAAIEAFETAARVDPTDTTLRFNAGSAHLLAGSEGAIEHLELAAETVSDNLRPDANYNLGNARLEAGDPAGAIASYEQALRLAPDHQAAKFNLELALQQQQEQQEQQGDEGDESDQQDKQDEQDKQQQQEPDPQNDEQEQGSEQQPQEQQQEPEEGDSQKPLPQFDEQPDMSAEQAAAILEAVENLEREQRRKQAEQEMKKRPHKGKDW